MKMPEKPINLMQAESEQTLSIDSKITVRSLLENKLIELSGKFIENREIYLKNRDRFESIIAENKFKHPNLSSDTPSRFITKLISIVVRKLDQVKIQNFANFNPKIGR
jgi:hypothetical protein